MKSEINKVIEKSGCNDLSKQYKYNEERASDKTKCKPILLLFNIQRIIIINRNMNQRTDTQLFNKFPFYLYKSENWDVEHIASNTDNDLTQPSEQKEWLKTFLLDSSISDDNKNRIKCFLGLEESGDFEDIRQNSKKNSNRYCIRKNISMMQKRIRYGISACLTNIPTEVTVIQYFQLSEE